MPSETPDLGEVLAEVVSFALGRISTSLPAQIVAYDPATQRAVVKPTISARYHDPETDALVPVPLPTISGVPVVFPSGTGFALTWPLVPGDTVLLVICDRSLDEWESTGAPENIPQDTRRFDLTDAVAIPSVRPSTKPIPASGWSAAGVVLEGASVQLGSSAAVSPVALAPLVDAVISALTTWLSTHTHTSAAPGSPTTPPVVPPPLPSSVAALKVKAE